MIKVAFFMAAVWGVAIFWVFKGVIAQGLKQVINSIKKFEEKQDQE